MLVVQSVKSLTLYLQWHQSHANGHSARFSQLSTRFSQLSARFSQLSARFCQLFCQVQPAFLPGSASFSARFSQPFCQLLPRRHSSNLCYSLIPFLYTHPSTYTFNQLELINFLRALFRLTFIITSTRLSQLLIY